jgi:hypothetical protein
MSKPQPPFVSEILQPGGQLAADSFIQLVGSLANHPDPTVSYADVIAGLIYATPVILAMSDEPEATRQMVKKYQSYVAAEYFPQLVKQWADFMQEMIDAHGGDGADLDNPIANTDLSTDPRFN